MSHPKVVVISLLDRVCQDGQTHTILNITMSDGKIEKMEKDFSPQVDQLLPETESLQQV